MRDKIDPIPREEKSVIFVHWGLGRRKKVNIVRKERGRGLGMEAVAQQEVREHFFFLDRPDHKGGELSLSRMKGRRRCGKIR